MKTEMPDIHVIDLCEIMGILEPMPPITRLYDAWGSEYPNQKAHMVHWFSTQDSKGSGQYKRRKANQSARMAYNRLLNAGALLWIAEALGETTEALMEAVQAAEGVDSWRKETKAFRAVIPFDRIMELIDHPEGWKIDKEVEPLLCYDEETGAPYVPDSSDQDYKAILEREFGE